MDTAPSDGSRSSVPVRFLDRPAVRWLLVLLLVYLLIVAVATIGIGFKQAAGDRARELFGFATNPFTGLIIGTVSTALIQSSSTVSSIIVGLVAGGLPVSVAVPMIMGANIGTTITNTIVSLGHVRDDEEFGRAFAAATIHDFFNLLSVVVFLPVEIMFHPLERMGGWLASGMLGGASVSTQRLNFIKPLTDPLVHALQGMAAGLGDQVGGVALISVGVILIMLTITWIGRLLKSLMVGRAKRILHGAVGRGPVTGIASGTVITVLVQSSSTTTSLIVPLVGAGIFSVRQIYPFTLGANIGTCITALLAAATVSGDTAQAALQLALVHLLYNVLGVIIIYGVPILREIPIIMAQWLAALAATRRSVALAYIVGVFFVFPLICIAISESV